MIVRFKRAIGRAIIKKQPNVVQIKKNAKKRKSKPKKPISKRKTKSRIKQRLK